MKQIIVCATQRSGSTMVCEDMVRVGLGNPNEYFIPWQPGAAMDWRAELGKLIGTKSGNGVFAAKVMANQIRKIDSCLAQFAKPLDTGPFPHFRSVFADAKWVLIKRNDTIAQAVSRFLAKGSGVYHVIKGRTGFVPGSAMLESAAQKKIADVPYDFNDLLQEWHQLQVGNLLWQEFFNVTGIEPIVLEYEGYDPAILQDLGRRFDIALLEPEGQRNLFKMPSARNDVIKQRFLEDLFSRV